MINFFQKYLQINTAHPTPDYDQALALFQEHAKNDGFAHNRIILPSGLPVLIITFLGSDKSLPALALNHHVDVVPISDQSQWKHDPFGGNVEDGVIYGRGTQDMKGVGVIHYWALKTLKDAGFKPRRTIHLIMVPHEEVGGFQGAGQLVKTKEFKDLNIGFVLDEALASGNEQAMFIKVSERKPVQIRVIATGDMVHGSRLNCINALHELSSFLADIASFQQEEQKEQKQGGMPAGLFLSMNITSLTAGIINNGTVSLNIVPGKAEATVDMRVPPIITIKEAKEIFHERIQDYKQLSYEILCEAEDSAYNQNYQTDLYQALATAVKNHGITPQPYYAEEASDLRFYTAQKIVGLGISPFTMQENIHRIDECVRIKDLERGCDIFVTFIKKFCG